MTSSPPTTLQAAWPSTPPGVTAKQQPSAPDLSTISLVAARIRHEFPADARALEDYIASQDERQPVPPPTLSEPEIDALERIIAKRRSENTRRQYDNAYSRFRTWCESRMGTSRIEPVHPTTLTLYLLHLFTCDYSQSTLSQAVAAVGYQHRERNLPDPTADPRVRAFMAGAARARKDRAPDQAKPITLREFETIQDSAALPATIAMISVMRDAMLRAGEMSRAEWSHIVRDPDGSATVTIPFSKNDQTGRGEIRYLQRATVEQLYKHGIQDDPRPFPYHPDTIARQIARACRAAELGEGYSGHSPRIGMSLDLLRRGATLLQVQREGRWKTSTMPAYYTRNEEARQGAVAQLMENHP